MDSKVNLFKLEVNSSNDKKRDGFSLRPNAFYSWLNSTPYDIKHVAKCLNLSKEELERKIKEKEPFTREQIRQFVFLAKATAAFHILYFKSFTERQRVYEYIFHRKMPIQCRKKKEVVRKNE